MAYDQTTAEGLVADLEAAQTALTAAVQAGTENYEAPGAALAGSRPMTVALATMATAITALSEYVESLAE